MDLRARIVESKQAQKALRKVPGEILRAYEIWARLIEEYGSRILWEFKGYHDEKLSGEWAGHRSSRLNRTWRLIYRSGREGQVEVVTVERITPHDYRRK